MGIGPRGPSAELGRPFAFRAGPPDPCLPRLTPQPRWLQPEPRPVASAPPAPPGAPAECSAGPPALETQRQRWGLALFTAAASSPSSNWSSTPGSRPLISRIWLAYWQRPLVSCYSAWAEALGQLHAGRALACSWGLSPPGREDRGVRWEARTQRPVWEWVPFHRHRLRAACKGPKDEAGHRLQPGAHGPAKRGPRAPPLPLGPGRERASPVALDPPSRSVVDPRGGI